MEHWLPGDKRVEYCNRLLAVLSTKIWKIHSDFGPNCNRLFPSAVEHAQILCLENAKDNIAKYMHLLANWLGKPWRNDSKKQKCLFVDFCDQNMNKFIGLIKKVILQMK